MQNLFRGRFVRVPLSERILFAKHLAMMIKAGMTEVESLRLVRRQVKSRGFARLLDGVIKDVESGQFLSESLKQYRNIFGDLFVNVVRIGEMSGTLPENLNYVSGELRKIQELRARVVGAMIYPAVILFATLLVISVLIFFIFPKILPVLQNSHIALPVTTKILMVVAYALQNYYGLIGGGLAVIIVLWIVLLRARPFRYFVHRLTLSIPVFGTVVMNYNTVNITRTMGILLKSQIKIVEAIEITSDIARNLVYKNLLMSTAGEIKRGEPLYRYWEHYERFIPATVTRMVEVGEKTGNLEGNLLYLAEFYENEVDDTLKNLSTILEPGLLIIMGMMVGFVALAIITPIYGITQTIQK